MGKVLSFIKKFWPLLAAIVLIPTIVIVVLAVLSNARANKVAAYLEGKTFISVNEESSTYKAYRFEDGQIAIESPNEGSIYTLLSEYKVKGSVFSNKLWVMTNYAHGYTRTVAVVWEDGVVKTYKHTDTTPDWEITTPEAVKAIAKVVTCEHAFSAWDILVEPTESTDGKGERTCSVCGKEESKSLGYTEWIVSYTPTIDEFTEYLLNITSFQIAEQSDTVTTYTNTGSLTDYSYIIAKTETNVTYVCNGRGETVSYDVGGLYDNPSLSVILKGTTAYHLDAWVSYFLGEYPNRKTASYLVLREGTYSYKTYTYDKTVDGVHYAITNKITTDSGLGTITANITIP